MPSIAEVESILSKYYVVQPPKHLLMLDRPAVGFMDGLCFFKGLQPKWRRDIVIIAPQGDDETVLHEAVHANFGFEEALTDKLGKILVLKHRVIESMPRLKQLWTTFRGRRIRYEPCPGCPICLNLPAMLIRPPAGARPRHFILAE